MLPRFHHVAALLHLIVCVLVGLLYAMWSCLVYLPRYVLMERRDVGHAVWGKGAEVQILYGRSSSNHAHKKEMIQRIACLPRLGRRERYSSATLAHDDGDDDDVVANTSLPRRSAPADGETASAHPTPLMEQPSSGGHVLQNLFTSEGIQLVQHGATRAPDDGHGRGDAAHIAAGRVSWWRRWRFHLRVPGWQRTRRVPQRRCRLAFLPPVYAVHPRVQLLLSMMDPLRAIWKLALHMMFSSSSSSTSGRRPATEVEEDSAVEYVGDASTTPAPLPASDAECADLVRDDDDDDVYVDQLYARKSGLRWLCGRRPDEQWPGPMVVLLLSPSISPGWESGHAARRVSALCAALSEAGALRMEHGLSPTAPTSVSSSSCATAGSVEDDVRQNPRYAQWYAGILHASVANNNNNHVHHGSRANVSVQLKDVEAVAQHLRHRLRRVATPEAPQPTNNNNSNNNVDGGSSGSGSGTMTRRVVLVGVGWSYGATPLLAEAIAHGSSSAMDALMCISHGLSTNFTLVPPNATNAAEGGLLPPHLLLTREIGGSARLLIILARLQCLAQKLRQHVAVATTSDDDVREDVAHSGNRRRSSKRRGLWSALRRLPHVLAMIEAARVEVQQDLAGLARVPRWQLQSSAHHVDADDAHVCKDEDTALDGVCVRRREPPRPLSTSTLAHYATLDWAAMLQRHDAAELVSSPGPSTPHISAAGFQHSNNSDTWLLDVAQGLPQHSNVRNTSLPTSASSSPQQQQQQHVKKKPRTSNVGRRPAATKAAAHLDLYARDAHHAALLKRIALPTLLVHARDDDVAPLATLPPQDLLERHPQLWYVFTRRGGHACFVENLKQLRSTPRLRVCRSERMGPRLMLEGTTWMEQLLVEFVASAVLHESAKTR